MELLLWLQQLRTENGASAMMVISALADEVTVIAVVCLILWCVDKREGYRMGLVYFLGGVVNQLLKVTLAVERPWVRDGRIQPYEGALPRATGYSFPSGHTASITMIATETMLWLRRRALYVLGGLLISLVMISRLYLGVHTPQDVLASLAISLIMVLLARSAMAVLEKSERGRYGVYAAALLLVGITVGATVYRAQHGTSIALAADACKTAGAALGFLVGWEVERRYVHAQTQAPWWGQAAKYLVGLALSLAIKSGLKAVLGTALWADGLRYGLLVLWVVAAYPAIFTRVFRKR